ncbi:MAG: glycosyl transferase [Mesonia hippocampi]|uniref:glycosyl transferase n=1 Tax=Mesonia hippocampi TaxID=1628250 RepID=UPI003F9AD877
MKLKELPKSLYHHIKLKTLPNAELSCPASERLPVIVSLTSISTRLHAVDITIRSILGSAKKPKKIILWLNEQDKQNIPPNLAKLENDIFSIRFTPLFCSHKKLIHTLAEFPSSTIITCDDDSIYHPKWLENLYRTHIEFPKHIIANQIRQIKYTPDGKIAPYKTWKVENPKDTKRILAIGAGGVLYPPNALSPIVQDKELFLKLTPKADDLWFKAMALLQGTPVMKNKYPSPWLLPIIGTQKVSLKKENVDFDKNSVQWEQLSNYFNFNLK